jgi:hypothetical protein
MLVVGCSSGTSTRSTAAQPLAVGFVAPSHLTHQIARAVTLPDGRVLVSDWEGSEIYDPATNTWTLTGAQTSTYRGYNALVVLADGRVLSTGGSGGGSGSSYVSSTAAELLDPATLTWTAAAPMNHARDSHALVRLSDGRVLAVGGLGYNVPSPGATAEIYDPAANTWTVVGAPASTAYNIAVLLPDGRVVNTGSGPTQLFDPATGQFTPMPGASVGGRDRCAAVLPSGKVLMFGGDPTTTELFDPGTGMVTTTSPLADPRRWRAAWGVVAGQAVIAGGYDVNGHSLASVERFDEATAKWVTEAPLLLSREDVALAPLPGGEALVVGGRTRWAPPNQNTVEVISQAKLAEVIHLGPCVPGTCASAGATCGQVADGCGGTLACGECGSGQACSAQHVCVCAPAGACAGRVCGSVPDGCGGTLSCGACATGSACSADGTACLADPSTALHDAALKVPACTVVSPACDSGTLLVGRGPAGPEANAPNNLGALCADGTGGAFHVDESLDRLRVATVDGGLLRAGASVRVEATAWAWSGVSSDSLDLYYAPNAASPAWQLLGTFQAKQAGAQVLSTTFTLAAGARQVVRGIFRYGTGATPPSCSAGSFNDTDDLVFAVETPPDTTPPSVGITAPAQDGVTVSGDVLLEAVATDDVAVARVDWYVVPTMTDPPAPTLIGSRTVLPYSLTWNSRPYNLALGYTILAKAYDAAGNEAVAARAVAVDNAGPTLYLDDPVNGATVAGAVVISARASDYSGVAQVAFYDGTALIATDTTAPYGTTWTPSSAGAHVLRAVATDGRGNTSEAKVTVTVPGPPAVPTAVFNGSAGAPECTALGAGCDSGALLVGRGRLGPEANAPNTLSGSCADGTVGAFHSDESLDRLRVEAAGLGGAVQRGATVKVTATTWAFSTGDILDLYYAPDAAAPVWTFVGTATATRSGAETVSLTFPLATAGATRQAIRGVFRYNGSRSPCPTGSYDDKDDLVFAVAP